MGEVSETYGEAEDTEYPGQRLGFPEDGPGSIASWMRRIAALAVDWLAANLVVLALGQLVALGDGLATLLPLIVFWLEASVFTALLGGSFGQLVVGLRVMRLDRGLQGRPLNLLQALLRTALICLVIPPLLANRDQRGLHDVAVGSVTVRLR